MRKLFVYSFWVLLCLPLQAQQNLVPNGDFEQYTGCPWGPNGIDLYVMHWFTPWSLVKEDSIGSSDYFHVCGHEKYAPSTNHGGVQHPHSGEAYSGICLGQSVFYIDWQEIEYREEFREYIEVELFTPLTRGKKYCYEFVYSIAEFFAGTYKPVSIGILLTDTIVKRNILNLYFSNGNTHAFPKPIISTMAYHDSTIVWLDTDHWFKISGEFIAQGGERYLTLGNFGAKDTATYKITYVYIDDVSLWLCENEAEPMPELLVVYPNPANEEINFGFSSIPDNESGVLEMFARHGQLVEKLHLNSGIDHAKILTHHLSQGIYLARLSYSTGEQASVKFMVRH